MILVPELGCIVFICILSTCANFVRSVWFQEDSTSANIICWVYPGACLLLYVPVAKPLLCNQAIFRHKLC